MKPWVLLSLGCGRRQYGVTEYQRSQEGAAHVAAARAGLEVRVVAGENDPRTQIEQIMEVVGLPRERRPVAVLVYTVNVFDYDQVARAALAAGIGWVLVDSPIPLGPLRADFPDALVSSITADSEAVGRLSAQLARSLLPGGGKALVIEGPSGTAVAIQRLKGLVEGLRGSNLQILETLVCDWKTSGAEKQAEAWLDRAGDAAPRPDIVISQNDEMAEGVLRTFRARRPAWGKLAAIGIDGLPDYGQRLVQEGVLAATILNPSPTGPGVDVVARWLRGERVDSVSLPVRPYPSIEELSPISGAG